MRRQWSLIGLAAVARFSGGILMGTALAVHVESAGSPLLAGVLAAAYFAGVMVFSPVWGAVADVTGRRRAVMVATGLLSAVAALPLLVVRGVWAAIGVRAVFAVFAAGFAPVVLAIVSHHGGPEGRGRSVGVYNATRSGGSPRASSVPARSSASWPRPRERSSSRSPDSRRSARSPPRGSRIRRRRRVAPLDERSSRR